MEEQSTVNGQTGETVRIYRDGMPSEGIVVSMAELEAMLNDGRLTGHDLIHHDGGWRPLDSVFEISEPPKAEHVDDAEPELALSLKQLPSVFAVGGGPVDAGFVGGVSGHKTAKKGSSTTVAVVVVVVVIIVAVVVWLAMKG